MASDGSTTLLTHHAQVLLVVMCQAQPRVRDIAAEVNLTERAVLRLIRQLEKDGWIQREKHGRRTTYTVANMPPIQNETERRVWLAIVHAAKPAKAG